MREWILFLRAVNVGGRNIIRMAELRRVLLEEGFIDVRTYLQSGNVILEHPEWSAEQIKERITKLIGTKFGIQTEVIICAPDMVKNVIAGNPFAEETAENPIQPYVALLDKEPQQSAAEAFKTMSFGVDRFCLDGKILYIWYAEGVRKTILSQQLIEKKLGVQSTIRNFKTILNLSQMVSEASSTE